MSEVHALLPQDSVKIITGRASGLMSVQIPVRLILGTDDVLRYARETGRTLEVKLVESEREGAAMRWEATLHGKSGIGATPWGALESLAKKLEAAT